MVAWPGQYPTSSHGGVNVSQEINLSFSLTAYKPAIMISAISRSIIARQFNMAGVLFTEGTVTIATGAGTTIPLGTVTQPHWAYFLNTDPNNYLTIQNGGGGTPFLRLYAGEGGAFPLDTACNPYGIANTAACLLEYLILSL